MFKIANVSSRQRLLSAVDRKSPVGSQMKVALYSSPCSSGFRRMELILEKISPDSDRYLSTKRRRSSILVAKVANR